MQNQNHKRTCRRPSLAAFLLLIVVFGPILSLSAYGDPPEIDPTLPVIVHYKVDQDPDAPLTIQEQHLGILYRARSLRAGVTGLHLQAGVDISKVLVHLMADPNVLYAEPNYLRHPIFTPNDPSYGQQYAPQIIDAPDAWNLTLGSSNVYIAIIDSGIDATHPDLAANTVTGIDDAIYGLGQTPTGAQHDALGHGTVAAGIASAVINNGVGIAGISNSKVVSIKVFPDNESASDLTISEAIRDASDHGYKIINLSLGGTGVSSTLQSAVSYAWAAGCVIIAAAGNDGSNEVFYPADATNVVAVAASNSSDQIASYSNYGSSITLAAPGDSILSTIPGGGYQAWSGTSMASPCVAGVAALMWSYNPLSTNTQIVAALEASADKVGPYTYDATGRNDHYGFGRVNAYKALLALRSLYASQNQTSQVRYYPRAGQASRMVGGQFQVSQNNITYMTVATITAAPAYAWTTLPVSVDISQYRYLRYLSPNGGWGNVAEVEFDSGAGSNAIKLGGTFFGSLGSFGNIGNIFSNAEDGNTSTFFDAPTANGGYVGIDRGVSSAVSQVRFYPRSGLALRMLGGQFQVSQDNVTYTTVATIIAVPTDGAWTALDTSVDLTKYRYLRYLSPIGGWGNVAEVEFDSGLGSSATKLTGTPFGSPGSFQGKGNTFDKAEDGNISTYFDAPYASGGYVGIDRGPSG